MMGAAFKRQERAQRNTLAGVRAGQRARTHARTGAVVTRGTGNTRWRRGGGQGRATRGVQQSSAQAPGLPHKRTHKHTHRHLTLQALARSLGNSLRAKARSHLSQELFRLFVNASHGRAVGRRGGRMRAVAHELAAVGAWLAAGRLARLAGRTALQRIQRGDLRARQESLLRREVLRDGLAPPAAAAMLRAVAVRERLGIADGLHALPPQARSKRLPHFSRPAAAPPPAVPARPPLYFDLLATTD